MRKIATLMMTCAALAVESAALAGDRFSYNLLDVGISYGFIDTNFESYAGPGLAISGSKEFTPHLFGFAALRGVSYTHSDLFGSDFEYHIRQRGMQLGLGATLPLGPRLDLVTGLSWNDLHRRYTYDTLNAANTLDADGPGLEVGLRALFGRHFIWTVGAGVSRLDAQIDAPAAGFDYLQGKFYAKSISSGFRIQFTPRYGAGVDLAGVRTGREETEVRAQLTFRWQFGDRDGLPD